MDNLLHQRQRATDTVMDYFTCWKIAVNTVKCQAICFSKRRDSPRQRTSVDNISIPWSPEPRFLLNLWKLHLPKVITKAKTSLRHLMPRHRTSTSGKKSPILNCHPSAINIHSSCLGSSCTILLQETGSGSEQGHEGHRWSSTVRSQ